MGDIRLRFEDQTRQLAVTDPSSPNLENYERMRKLCNRPYHLYLLKRDFSTRCRKALVKLCHIGI